MHTSNHVWRIFLAGATLPAGFYLDLIREILLILIRKLKLLRKTGREYAHDVCGMISWHLAYLPVNLLSRDRRIFFRDK